MFTTLFEDLTPYKQSYYDKVSELSQVLERAKNFQYLLSGEQKQQIAKANEAINRFKILSNKLENEIGSYNYFNSKYSVKQNLINEQNIVEELSETIKNIEMDLASVAYTRIYPVWDNDQLKYYEAIFKWTLNINCQEQVKNIPQYQTQTVTTTNLDNQKLLYSICRNEFNFLSQIPQFQSKIQCLNSICHFQIVIAKNVDIIQEKFILQQFYQQQQFENNLIKIYIKQLAKNSVIIKKGNRQIILSTNQAIELSKDCEIIIFQGLSYSIEQLFIFQKQRGQN